MQKFILVLVTLLSMVQISCKKSDRTSVLVIAVDNLTMTDVPCNQDDKVNSGFQMLCDESVRFTHAFTSSTLSVPALASLLTGLYPYQHKVHHNGGPGLLAESDLASEIALKHDYRTSFFSGGAPVFRRSGLNQGFELFEDNLIPSFSSLFRPFKKNIDAFMAWLNQEVEAEPFFSVIYAPDLLFTTTETTTNLGETRNLSVESQIDEFDENLFELLNNLKKEQRWDSTTIILMGLNGRTSDDRPEEVSANNLHGDKTQVALLIKPSQKRKRDEAIHWKIDQNVNTVDVGRTLFELLGESIVDETTVSFPAHSLIDLLKNPNSSWSEGRPLLTESGWALWRKAGDLRTAVISGYVLYINDQPPLLYNTLLDRFESTPLPLLQESLLATTQKIQSLLSRNQFNAFTPMGKEWTNKLRIPYSRWMRIDQEPLLLKDLKKLLQAQPQSEDLLNWTAQIALNQKDWDTLKFLGMKYKNPLWQLVAEKNLGAKDLKVTDPCILLLTTTNLESESLKKCNSSLFLEMVDWIRADDRGLSKDIQRKRFERSFRNYMLDQYIQRNNIAAGLIWDTSRENQFAPSKTELALHFPEYSKIRNAIYKSLQYEE